MLKNCLLTENICVSCVCERTISKMRRLLAVTLLEVSDICKQPICLQAAGHTAVILIMTGTIWILNVSAHYSNADTIQHLPPPTNPQPPTHTHTPKDGVRAVKWLGVEKEMKRKGKNDLFINNQISELHNSLVKCQSV